MVRFSYGFTLALSIVLVLNGQSFASARLTAAVYRHLYLRTCGDLLAEKMSSIPSHAVLILTNMRPEPMLGFKPRETRKFEVLDYNPRTGDVLLIDLKTGSTHQHTIAKLVELTLGTAQLRPAHEVSDAWHWYAVDFQKHTAATMRRHRAVYVAAKKRNHPYVEFLESLGVKIQPKIELPDLKQIMMELERRILSQIDGAVVTRQDVLLPARVFIDKQGKQVYLRFGEEVPQGFRPHLTLLSNIDLLEMIASGFYPTGEHHTFIRGETQTTFLHDLSHWRTFVKYPSFSKALRRAAEGIVSGRINLHESPAYMMDLQERMLWTMEFLSIIPPEKIPELKHSLTLPTRAESHDVPSIQAHLKRMSHDDLTRAITRAIEFYERARDPIGGADGDLFSVKAVTDDRKLQVTYVSLLAQLLKIALEDCLNEWKAPRTEIYDRDRLIYHFARFEIAMLYGLTLPPEKWIEGFLRPDLSLSPEFLKIYCKKGFWPLDMKGVFSICP